MNATIICDFLLDPDCACQWQISHQGLCIFWVTSDDLFFSFFDKFHRFSSNRSKHDWNQFVSPCFMFAVSGFVVSSLCGKTLQEGNNRRNLAPIGSIQMEKATDFWTLFRNHLCRFCKHCNIYFTAHKMPYSDYAPGSYRLHIMEVHQMQKSDVWWFPLTGAGCICTCTAMLLAW